MIIEKCSECKTLDTGDYSNGVFYCYSCLEDIEQRELYYLNEDW